jgi:carboxymethylenebutenolidase
MRLQKIMLVGFIWVAGATGQEGGGTERFETVFYPSGKLKIEAYVYKPEGAGPFPAVIYNHGSRKGRERVQMPFVYVGAMLANAKNGAARLAPGAKALLQEARYVGAKAWTPNGYVVVVPERRGYGRSDGKQFSEEIGDDRGPRYVSRLQEEADDVIAAAEFAKTLPYVDGARIGVMGWSFGGIVSVFAASRGSAFRAVVDQAGGALSWDGSPALQRALKEAAERIRVPLLGMVAENDRTTQSVKVVVQEAEKHGGNAKLIVYPAFAPRENPNGIAPGHMIFGVEGARIWERDLEEFLGRYMQN